MPSRDEPPRVAHDRQLQCRLEIRAALRIDGVACGRKAAEPRSRRRAAGRPLFYPLFYSVAGLEQSGRADHRLLGDAAAQSKRPADGPQGGGL